MNTSADQFQLLRFCCAVCCCCCVCITPSPSSVRCGSRGATAAVFQGIPFVAATSGVLVRVRLCACWYAILNTIWTLGILPLIFKSARAVHRHPNSYGTTSSEPHLGSYTYGMYEGTPVFPFCNLGHPRDLLSQPSRRS